MIATLYREKISIKESNTKLSNQMKYLNKEISDAVKLSRKSTEDLKNIKFTINKLRLKKAKCLEKYKRLDTETKYLKQNIENEKKKFGILNDKIEDERQITKLLKEHVQSFLGNFEHLLDEYFGIKINLKSTLTSKKSSLSKLQENLGKVRSSVKGLYSNFALDIKNEKTKVIKLSNVLQSLKSKCNDKEDIERSLETALEVSENYKLRLKKEQNAYVPVPRELLQGQESAERCEELLLLSPQDFMKASII